MHCTSIVDVSSVHLFTCQALIECRKIKEFPSCSKFYYLMVKFLILICSLKNMAQVHCFPDLFWYLRMAMFRLKKLWRVVIYWVQMQTKKPLHHQVYLVCKETSMSLEMVIAMLKHLIMIPYRGTELQCKPHSMLSKIYSGGYCILQDFLLQYSLLFCA